MNMVNTFTKATASGPGPFAVLPQWEHQPDNACTALAGTFPGDDQEGSPEGPAGTGHRRPPSPAETESDTRYAGFWIRFLSFILDTVILSPISWGGANLVYRIGMWTWRGQTLGHIVINTRIIRTNGQPVDLRTAVLRYLGYILCYLTLGIGFLIIAFDKRKQGLHDKIANTYVIRV